MSEFGAFPHCATPERTTHPLPVHGPWQTRQWPGATPPIETGPYVLIRPRDSEYIANRDAWWSEHAEVHVMLTDGTGRSIHTVDHEDATDNHDQLSIPEEWLRPLAEALLKHADALDAIRDASA